MSVWLFFHRTLRWHVAFATWALLECANVASLDLLHRSDDAMRGERYSHRPRGRCLYPLLPQGPAHLLPLRQTFATGRGIASKILDTTEENNMN